MLTNGRDFLLNAWKYIKGIALILFQKGIELWQRTSLSVGQTLALVIPSFIFLYYFLGAMIIQNIDTSASVYKASTEGNRSAVIDMSAYLIRREVKDNLWTPSLPFLFPSYFLDNMPNFQRGLISAVSKTISALSVSNFVQTSENNHLQQAAQFLKYPSNVWLFSPKNKLMPAPSSATQYKKGRKELNRFNDEFSLGHAAFELSPKNFANILTFLAKDLISLETKTETYIRENSKSLIDTKADDTFYFARGKLYTYEMLFRALGLDFKEVLVQTDTYALWTSLIKDLEAAADLNPTFVRNGKLNSSITPNHLATINYLNLKAYERLKTIIQQLENFSEAQK